MPMPKIAVQRTAGSDDEIAGEDGKARRSEQQLGDTAQPPVDDDEVAL